MDIKANCNMMMIVMRELTFPMYNTHTHIHAIRLYDIEMDVEYRK